MSSFEKVEQREVLVDCVADMVVPAMALLQEILVDSFSVIEFKQSSFAGGKGGTPTQTLKELVCPDVPVHVYTLIK